MSVFRNLFCERSGTILVGAAFTFPILIGFAALGIDAGYWYYEHRRLQNAVDAAAMAAAFALNREGAEHSEYEAAGRNDAAANGFVHGENAMVTIPASLDGSTVRATIEMQPNLFFASLFLEQGPVLSAQAGAALVGGFPCLIALHETAAQAMRLSGTPDIIGENCAVHINSVASGHNNNQDALSANGSPPILTAEAICVNGGWPEPWEGGTFTPEPHHCEPTPDPLASLSPPDIGGCLEVPDIERNGPTYFSPGTYCESLHFSGQDEIVFMPEPSGDPGIYVFTEGISIQGQADVRGENVMFFLTGNSRLNFRGKSTLELSAPESGEYQGVLIFQDSSVTMGSNDYHKILGTNETSLRGAIYMPTGNIEFGGTGDVQSNGPLVAVASTFWFHGTPTWSFRAESTPDAPLPTLYEPRISLVE